MIFCRFPDVARIDTTITSSGIVSITFALLSGQLFDEGFGQQGDVVRRSRNAGGVYETLEPVKEDRRRISLFIHCPRSWLVAAMIRTN